jgi:hypothetical protein
LICSYENETRTAFLDFVGNSSEHGARDAIFARGVSDLHGGLELTGAFRFTDTSYTDLYADDLYDFQHCFLSIIQYMYTCTHIRIARFIVDDFECSQSLQDDRRVFWQEDQEELYQ